MDPFGTAGLRRDVLAAWAASPARFREDANTEEDFALGGHRDRLIVELAQNAADAAVRAGVRGRLLLDFDGDALTAANTGAPLDTEGVIALSTMRASAKRGPDDFRGAPAPDAAPAPGTAHPGADTGPADHPDAPANGAGHPLGASSSAHGTTRAASWPQARATESVHARLPEDPHADDGAAHEGPSAAAEGTGSVHTQVSDGPRLEGAVRTDPSAVPHDAEGVHTQVPERPVSGADARPAPAPDAPGHTTVGRYGVGFAAVVAVSDEPAIAGAAGAVHWSLRRTLELLAEVPSLAGELAERHGRAPVLRLPFAGPAEPGADLAPPPGYDTVVRLPLRDAAARGLVRRLLDEAGPALLLALPALEEVEIRSGGRTRVLAGRAEDEHVVTSVDGAETRWRLAAASGRVSGELLADRPVEERARPYWYVRWAVPVDAEDAPVPLPEGVPAVLHAPTPSDEPVGLPAVLLAGYPLAPDRRHVAEGPLADMVTERAADAYAALLAALPPRPALLKLVPGPLAEGALDARLRRAILARLPETPFLPTSDGTRRQRPADSVALETGPASVAALTDAFPGSAGLLPPDWPVRDPALTRLGVRRIGAADLADLLADLDRPPAWWRGLYAALEGADADALGALPVPLADGRLVRGPRGALLPEPGLDAAALQPLELRIVHPEAAHPLLARLGARPADPRAVLADPRTRAAVEGSLDAEDPDAIAGAVLTLAAEAGATTAEHPWLADLALTGDDGDHYPAGDLLFPDAPLREVLADDHPFGTVDPALVDRHGAEALRAVGVLSTFSTLHAQDVPLSEPDLPLDGAERWAADLDDPESDVPPVIPELVAVRDLDLIDPSRWDAALRLLAEPPLRDAVVRPVRVLGGDGRAVDRPSYTAWWLRHQARLGGHRPADLRMPGSDPLLSGLYAEAPAGGDTELLRALGVRTSLDALLAEPAGADELLERLADPANLVGREQLVRIWAALAALDPDAVTPPDRVRVLRAGAVDIADAEDALVLDAPDLLPLLGDRPLVVVPRPLTERIADVLDLELAGEAVPAAVRSIGEPADVPDVVDLVLPDAPTAYLDHDDLIVDGTSVTWRYTDDEVHAATLGGLARGLAWASGHWPLRHLLEAVLTEPERAAELLAEAALDD
ncbi:hypothetical protein [Allonocardiopsis opalescens]|uniref:Molecular chaperone Hsp90 n=1 Tax=Allonocardiopsis opalescens TaxID=1144618 RepID=A0A2T0Q9Z3_9ACTN|nr:hypothetical protein [Allonocardiopsis opalescens]PRY00657.1 hypothetical protein CLV72_102288 [Allonocardiopsis opalescens]